MKSSIKLKIISALTVLVIIVPLLLCGCDEDESSSGKIIDSGSLYAPLVPNTEIDLLVFGKQDEPTRIPARMIDAMRDIDVDSISVWGVPSGDDFAIGIGITLATAGEASRVYQAINAEADAWTYLNGNAIYMVEGTGEAATELKTAIQEEDFRTYDDAEFQTAIAKLPPNTTDANLVGIAVAAPTSNMIAFASESENDEGTMSMINLALNMLNLQVIAGGFYSEEKIDIAEIDEMLEQDKDLSLINAGAVALIKSGIPGLILEPAVEEILKQQEFSETTIDGTTVFVGYGDNDEGENVVIIVRVEGNSIFASVSGNRSYAENLIMSVQP